MTESLLAPPALLVALVVGAILGLFFFLGLWWTVRRIEVTDKVALLFLSSMLIRTSVVILGFYLILGDNWQRLIAGLLGFIIARTIVIRLTSKWAGSKRKVAVSSS